MGLRGDGFSATILNVKICAQVRAEGARQRAGERKTAAHTLAGKYERTEASAMRPEFITVGTVVNAHGIRGEVKVNPLGYDPSFLTEFGTLYIGGQPVEIMHQHIGLFDTLLSLF